MGARGQFTLTAEQRRKQRWKKVFSYRLFLGAQVMGLVAGFLAFLLWEPLFWPAFALVGLGTFAAVVLDDDTLLYCPHCGRKVGDNTVDVCKKCGRDYFTVPVGEEPESGPTLSADST